MTQSYMERLLLEGDISEVAKNKKKQDVGRLRKKYRELYKSYVPKGKAGRKVLKRAALGAGIGAGLGALTGGISGAMVATEPGSPVGMGKGAAAGIIGGGVLGAVGGGAGGGIGGYYDWQVDKDYKASLNRMRKQEKAAIEARKRRKRLGEAEELGVRSKVNLAIEAVINGADPDSVMAQLTESKGYGRAAGEGAGVALLTGIAMSLLHLPFPLTVLETLALGAGVGAAAHKAVLMKVCKEAARELGVDKRELIVKNVKRSQGGLKIEFTTKQDPDTVVTALFDRAGKFRELV